MFPIPFNFPFRKKDGSITTMDDAISSGGGSYTLPTASAETKGGVKVGSGLTMDGETLKNTNPTPFTLPTASAETLGGVKVGSGLSIDEGVLSTAGGGGGTKLYYKDFPFDGKFTRTELIASSGIWLYTKYTGATNINVNGYIAVRAEPLVNISPTNFCFNEVHKNDTEFTTRAWGVTFMTNHPTNLAGGFNYQFRVYYVKESDTEQLT